MVVICFKCVFSDAAVGSIDWNWPGEVAIVALADGSRVLVSIAFVNHEGPVPPLPATFIQLKTVGDALARRQLIELVESRVQSRDTVTTERTSETSVDSEGRKTRAVEVSRHLDSRTSETAQGVLIGARPAGEWFTDDAYVCVLRIPMP